MKKYIRSMSFLFLYLVYVLMCLFYTKKKRICFISFPDASDNSWYLYKYCLKSKINYEIVWLVDDYTSDIKDRILKISEKNNINVKVLKRWSLKGLIYFCSSELVFHTHGTYFFIRKTFRAPIIVNLWHGMPIKAIGFLDSKNNQVDCSDFSISTSVFYQNIIAECFGLKKENVLISNLPRNDVLYSGISSKEKESIYKKLGLDDGVKIITWLPTYRVSNLGDIRRDSASNSFLNDLDSSFLEKLNEICRLNKFYVLIKLHPMDSLNILDYHNKYAYIRFYDSATWSNLGIELYDLLSMSDGLISDLSSVIIDCIPTSIPVGMIKGCENNYSRKVVTPLKLIKENIFIIRSAEDVVELVFFRKRKLSTSIFLDEKTRGSSSDFIVNRFIKK